MTRPLPLGAVAVEVARVALIDGPAGARAEECVCGGPALAPGETITGHAWAINAVDAYGLRVWLEDLPELAIAMARAMAVAGPLPVRGTLQTRRDNA